MKITILNGSPQPSLFDNYLARLQARLESNGHQVTAIPLRDQDIRFCVGCFGCWVKTPGECLVKDEACNHRRALLGSDFTLLAAPLCMGFPSALLKKTLDKSLPNIHPYFAVVNGEAHHRKRYPHYPRLGMLVETETDTDEGDLAILSDLFSRSALNMKSALEFFLTTVVDPDEIARRIVSQPQVYVPYTKNLLPTTGVQISPPTQLTLFNGSPRGRKGNTPMLLEQFGTGFASAPGRTVATHHLIHMNKMDSFVESFASAGTAWLGFPLYVDAMPGSVKVFIEALQPLKGRKSNPPLGFLVQSGFPEGLHSRYVERYLEKLAARLGSPYLGTIVKGGGEAVRVVPTNANRKLFSKLQSLGQEFALTGALNPRTLHSLVGVERYPAILAPLFKAFIRLPIASWYWDTQLQQNGAYDLRDAQPYLE